jgi:REP element-mobilizing transposase RayT
MPSSHHGILLHIVFSTKNRIPLILPSWQDDLYAYIGGIAKEHKAIVLCSGGVEDHIHLLVKTHPSFAIADTVQLIKSNSSRWVNQERKTTGKFHWQRGYGVFSVSQSQSDIVKQYIRSQAEHHKRRTFQEEYLEILRRYEIEFDERYVFDEEIIT